MFWAVIGGFEIVAGFALLALGVLGGVFLGERHGTKASRIRELERELESERQQRTAYSDSVGKHFDGTSDLFRDLTRQYATLYAHLSEGARELCPDQVPEIGRGYQDPALRIGATADSPEEVESDEPTAPEPDEQTNAA